MVEKYLRMPDLDIDGLIVIPNLLESYNSGIGPRVGKTAYAILGPSEDGIYLPRIQHELLHSIINPLTEDYELTKRSRLREYVIRAMVLRMNRESEYYESRRERLLEKGYERMDDFLNWLEKYEQSDKPFAEFLKQTVGGLAVD